MASKIRIHRSTGASAPSSLEFGELAATVEQGAAGTSANKAGRLFIGNVAGNPVEIGGEYTYKLLDHTPGELHLTSALVTDANANINGLRIAGIATITRTDITDAVTQNLRVTGVGTFVAGLDLNGNVTIGNQHTDILTINSRTGVSTDMTLNNGLKVVGLSTFSNSVDVNATSAFGDDVTFETENTKNILIEGNEGYKKAQNFMKMVMPSHVKKIKKYRGKISLFIEEGIEQKLNQIFDSEIKLNSGGYLVINPTEALVSIDINSGSSIKQKNVESTALDTNLEAADEIARQITIRDLSGLIIIDFIDMLSY